MNPARSLVIHYSRARALKALTSSDGTLVAPDSAWRRCIGLVQQLCCQPNAGGVTAGVFQDLAIILRSHNEADHTLEDAHALQKSLHVALSLSSSLQSEFGKDGVPSAFEEAFLLDERRVVDDEKLLSLWRISFCLVALLSIAPSEILDVFASNTKLLAGLAKCYDTVLSRYSSMDSERQISKIALRSKVNIIDSVHILFEHCSSRPWAILDMLFPILDLPTTSPPSSSTAIMPFGDRTLLGDYEATYQLSSRLSSNDVGDPRYEFVRAQLRSLVGRSDTSPSSMNPEASGALKALLPLTKASVAEAPGPRDKGKGKATSNDANAENEAVYAAMSQILDVLPDENPAFLQACLNHPAFDGPSAVEKLLGALLEGGPLPDGLDRLRNGMVQDAGGISTEPKTDLVASRRNAFENDPMDFSRLRVGKKRHVGSLIFE
jgi:activating signal cointegrator complex subunit 2